MRLSFRQRYTRHYMLFALTAILLLIAASRIVRLRSSGMIDDEVWSVWQTMGTPQQIISWTAYDWPPFFYLVMGFWKALVGITPVADRFLSLLFLLLGCAALFRAMRRLTNSSAGMLAMIAYAALGYSIHISNQQRGYALLLGAYPFALWFTVRYFHSPTLRRAIPLALVFIVMVYTHVTAVFAIAVLGLFTLVVYRRQIWRWWLPGLLTGVAIAPLISAKLALAQGYVGATQTIAQRLPPFAEAMISTFADLTGYSAIIWAILFLVSAVLIFYRWRRRSLVYGLLVWLIMPAVLYLARSVIGSFITPRLLWWVLLALAVWIGWGLSALQTIKSANVVRGASALAVVAMSVAMFMPISTLVRDDPPPLIENLEFMKAHMQRYDVVLVDPNCDTVHSMEWDYFQKIYFPDGLQYVTSPEGHRRVWYVTREDKRDYATSQAVTKGRIAGIFVGPPRLLFRLYEAPPDPQGVLFENGMRFHGAEFVDNPYPGMAVFHEGETFKLRLWWSVDKPTGVDYSASLFVFREGFPTIQSDGPQENPDTSRYTSTWKPDRFYIEERELTIPNPYRTSLTVGGYPIMMAVYQSWDGTKISAPGLNADKLLTIEHVNVKEW